MKYSILKKLKINRPTIALTTLLFMLAGPTSAWADGSGTPDDPWISGGCNVTLDNGTLTVSKSATGNGAMADYEKLKTPWDQYYKSLTSVVIEDGVTEIGDNAFYYLTKIATISLGSNLTTIGNSAFELCNGLTSVTIPASVTSIGTKAFNNCSKLESITVDASNANYASEDGVLLNKAKETLIQYPGGKSGSYTIPASVTNIDDYAFNACENLETVSFGNGVTRIGNYAFQNCKNLTTISFGSGLKTILLGTFQGCTSLSSVNLPASLTNIGSEAFAGCTKLATATLNSNPNIAGGNTPAFYNNTTVTMNLTATVGESGEYWMTFYNKKHNFQVPATGTQIFKAALSEDKLTLRELTTDKIVTKNNAVILKSETPSITLTWTTSDSSNDFSDNSLSGVSAVAGLTAADPSKTYALNSGAQGVCFYKEPTGNTIGVGNAYETSTSTSDFLPLVTVVASGNCGTTNHESDVTWELTDKGTLTISGTGTGAMADYDWAKPNGIGSPFRNNPNITSVVIGEGVTSIGSEAFMSCSNLTTVSIPSTLTTIGEVAFLYCPNLTTINVAAGNTHLVLDNGILYDSGKTTALVCPAKKGGDIVLPATVTTLYRSLFNKNTNITSLDLSACTNLTTVSGSLCSGCTALASVTLPTSVEIIDQMAFQGCNQLTTINLSACTGLTMIRLQAFNGCSLLAGTYTLPNTVTCIGTSAFANCAALQELVIQSALATFTDDPNDNYDSNGFGGAFDGCTLLKLSISDTDLAEDMLSNTNHNWHRYAYMLKTMPFTVSGVTLSSGLNASLDMTSNTAVEVAKNIAVSNVNLTCTLTEGKPCTVMFPFAVALSQIGGGTFYEFTGVTYDGDAGKWKATMTALSYPSQLEANTPYLLVPSGSAFASNIDVNGVLNTTTNSKQTVVGDWTFNGVYAEKTWAAADCGKDYGFAASSGKAVDGITDVAVGDFVKVAAGAHIKPMRAYLTYTGTGNPTANAPRRAGSELPQSISVVLVNTDGSTTEIGTLTPSYSDSEGVWYSLDGVRLNSKPTTKGLYINNGKKVVIK